MKVPHLMSIRPMECWLATLSASFCDNVTCFGTSKSCSNQSHLQECFNCSSLLAWTLRVQLSTCYPISLSGSFRIHLAASLCVLPNAFKTFCSNKLGILTGTRWYSSDISSDISAPWAHEMHESTSLDVNKANGMLAGNTKRISSATMLHALQVNLNTPYSFPLSASCRLLSRHSVPVSEDY